MSDPFSQRYGTSPAPKPGPSESKSKPSNETQQVAPQPFPPSNETQQVAPQPYPPSNETQQVAQQFFSAPRDKAVDAAAVFTPPSSDPVLDFVMDTFRGSYSLGTVVSILSAHGNAPATNRTAAESRIRDITYAINLLERESQKLHNDLASLPLS